MTSAPSLRLRSSGNSILLAAGCLLLVLTSCTASRKATRPTPGQRVPPQQGDMISVYDPVTGTYILVPREQVGADTIRKKEETPVPVTPEKDTGKLPVVTKDRYEIALLMPFNAREADFFSESQDNTRLNRFVQYYAGVLMALEDRNTEAPGLSIRVYDTDTPAAPLEQTLRLPKLREADVVIGPYEKASVEAVAAFGLEHEAMIVSPWQPAFSVTSENPFFIQLSPGLQAHAHAMMEYIGSEMRDRNVYIVGRNHASDISRIQLFAKAAPPGLKPEELIIDDQSPDLGKTDLAGLLNDMQGTVFILPFYSKSDETFVYSFMRKLHADKGTREAIVFGLPQWLGFTNLNSNLMESLSLHLSSAAFIDTHHPAYAGFRTAFFRKYHAIPDQNAFLGYDLVNWLKEQLAAEGPDGLIHSAASSHYGLASGFDIRPVYKPDTGIPGEMRTPLYYENQRIRIIRYVEQDFVVVR